MPGILRVLLGLWGLMFMVGLLLLGLVVGAGLLIWAVLTGRKPVLRFQQARAHWQGFRQGAGRATPGAPADVVEGQAREVDGPRERIERD
jgi:hypothetical protein